MLKRLGIYELVRKIATGGMADVFEAVRLGCRGFRQRVALKCLRPDMATDPRFVEQFVREARLGSVLQHPNIASVSDFNEYDGVLCMAMEYLHGTDLNVLLQHLRITGQRIPHSLAAHITLQVLAGLSYSHDGRHRSEGVIVHRDIKPHNIMLTHHGEVKITDFGIARIAENPGHITSPGIVLGTLSYMSPEQLAGRPVTPASDLYSVGLLLFEMIMQRPLFEGETSLALRDRVSQADVATDLHELRRQVPAYYPIIARALLREPERRYSSAAAFQAALRPMAIQEDASALCATYVNAMVPALPPVAPLVAPATAPTPPAPARLANHRPSWLERLVGVSFIAPQGLGRASPVVTPPHAPGQAAAPPKPSPRSDRDDTALLAPASAERLTGPVYTVPARPKARPVREHDADAETRLLEPGAVPGQAPSSRPRRRKARADDKTRLLETVPSPELPTVGAPEQSVSDAELSPASVPSVPDDEFFELSDDDLDDIFGSGEEEQADGAAARDTLRLPGRDPDASEPDATEKDEPPTPES